MARHVRALADHEAGRFHAREPLRRSRPPGMGRRGDPFLRESTQAGGLVRRRCRQMGEDPVGRGIEPLPAVPPRHAKGLGAIHLSVWKPEHFSLRFRSNLIRSDGVRTRSPWDEPTVLDGRTRLADAGQRLPPRAEAKTFRSAARRCFDTAARVIPTKPAICPNVAFAGLA